MSTLTEEQKKRIEENRQKALDRRAAAAAQAVKANQTQNKPIAHSSIQKPIFFSNAAVPQKPNFNKPVENKTLTRTSTSLDRNFSSSSNSTKVTPQCEAPKFYGNSVGTSGGNQSFTGKKITGTFVLISTSRFQVDVPYQQQMLEIFKSVPSRQYDATTRKWSFSLEDHSNLVTALTPLRPAVCVSPLPLFVQKALKVSEKYPPSPSIDLMNVESSLLEAFMPFQREGVCFGISRGGRVLIADDMGLGKTVQALGIASYYRHEWPMLIITPASVRYTWAEAIDRWVGSINMDEVVIVNSGKDELSGEVVVMTYDLLTRREKEIQNMCFRVVIMDESHMLKNFKSSRYKAAANIMKRSSRLIMLSGTPALSRPSELYTQISSINPSLLPNFQDYGIRYCAGRKQPWGWDYSGSSNMEELQIILESTIMIRRLKADVLSQLPAKQRMTVLLDPSSIRLKTKAMEEAMKHFKQQMKGSEKHGALLELFRESAVAKSKAVCDYLKELIEQEKKFLVFAHHRIMMDKICESCEEMKVHYIRIDGSTGSEARQKLVDHFQYTPDTRVAVLSITAANTGVTLTAAQLVVFAELYWNPGLLVQAEDRVHRIGQVDSVLVQYLVAKGTADDHIWPLIQSKLNVLNKVGLSNDNFSSAASTNQKVKAKDGILKYLTDLDFEDILSEDFPDEPSCKKIKSSTEEDS